MGGFGEELARGLLSHDIFGVGRVGEEVGWIGLAIAELGGEEWCQRWPGCCEV